MRFKIDPKIFEKFQGLNVGVVIAKGIDNSGVAVTRRDEQYRLALLEEMQDKIRGQEKIIRENLTTETLPSHPKIDVWRKTYSAFGAKPKEHRSSVENLYRVVVQNINLRSINKLVDIYNFISLKYMLPVGGEDIDKMQGDISLTFAGASESPVLLLGEKEPRPPREREVIYKDSISTICRRWNWREADRTKLTEETKNCILVIEGLPPVTKEEIENATRELKELIEGICGGNVTYSVLEGNKSEIEF